MRLIEGFPSSFFWMKFKSVWKSIRGLGILVGTWVLKSQSIYRDIFQLFYKPIGNYIFFLLKKWWIDVKIYIRKFPRIFVINSKLDKCNLTTTKKKIQPKRTERYKLNKFSGLDNKMWTGKDKATHIYLKCQFKFI